MQRRSFDASTTLATTHNLQRIVTGDETWVYCYQPESKHASKQLKRKESSTLKVMLSVRKVIVTVFRDMKGVLLVEFQEQSGTVNASSYSSVVSYPFLFLL